MGVLGKNISKELQFHTLMLSGVTQHSLRIRERKEEIKRKWPSPVCWCALQLSSSLINQCADNLTPCWPAAVCSLSQKSSVTCGHQLQASRRTGATTGQSEEGISLACSPLHLQQVHSNSAAKWWSPSKRRWELLPPSNKFSVAAWDPLMPTTASGESQPRGSDGNALRSGCVSPWLVESSSQKADGQTMLLLLPVVSCFTRTYRTLTTGKKSQNIKKE